MKKIISFCLYGNKSKYTIGAIKNSEFAPSIYPGWICRFYVNNTVPEAIIAQLLGKGAEIVRMDAPSSPSAMLWRYRCVEDSDVDAAIFRDCDSRISQREASAVKEWLDSGKAVHIMRDHPNHTFPILGGMWGIRPGKGVLIPLQLANKYPDKYGADQFFVADRVYPQCNQKNCMVHATFWKYERYAIDFPCKRLENAFVGESIDEYGNFDKNARQNVNDKIGFMDTLRTWIKYMFRRHICSYYTYHYVRDGIKHIILSQMSFFSSK